MFAYDKFKRAYNPGILGLSEFNMHNDTQIRILYTYQYFINHVKITNWLVFIWNFDELGYFIHFEANSEYLLYGNTCVFMSIPLRLNWICTHAIDKAKL